MRCARQSHADKVKEGSDGMDDENGGKRVTRVGIERGAAFAGGIGAAACRCVSEGTLRRYKTFVVLIS